mmetsp:Transcript_23218/g.39864  ORF Transcript_23218/g.39864 Transcript_23218/m.39864 type:complete len:1049 (+) Transcript_23218:6115-9261(+)
MTYNGYIDQISDNTVVGWACDSDNPERSLFVEITDGTGCTIRTCACEFREDLKAKNFGQGYHGFSVTLSVSGEQADLERSMIRARIVGSSYELPNLNSTSDKTMMQRAKLKAQNLGQNSLRKLSGDSDKKELARAAAQKSGEKPAGHAKSLWSYDTLFSSLPTEDQDTVVFGKIRAITGGQIEVLVRGGTDVCVPLVFVAGKPAWQDPATVELTGEDEGFVRYHFYISGIALNDEISLWAVVGEQVQLCEARLASSALFERAILGQLARAAKIARDPNAVAITCWDGGHNPIGRAKVLFDALKGNRPVVMFVFLFKEFGGDIWPPLTSVNENIVTIPWAERFFYLKAAAAMGLQFHTIWMCKPRAPTFQMAVNIAHPDAKVILDMDDNEDHFSQSKASQSKAYGLPSIGLSRALMAGVKARTAASVSLIEDYDAVMVRHARQDASNVTPIMVPGASADPGVVKVGFIGTVRPHKQIMEAARAITKLNQASGKQFEFHAYGDVQPQSLQSDLEAEGVIVKQNIPLHQLSGYLRGMDIILTGFPSGTEADGPITKYQISSKIGDGLSVGRPVLVPSGPSVADLGDVPGVFLFTQDNFAQQLLAAQASIAGARLKLADQFTMGAAYQGFLKAEKIAETSPRCAQALSLVPPVVPPQDQNKVKPTLLLIWKQHDGALYGRRMDLLCRSYRRVFPDHRIVVLEVLYPDFDLRYRDDAGDLTEKAHIRALNISKRLANMQDGDGVEYRQLMLPLSVHMNAEMQKFLISNQILPTNTVIVLYPNIMHLDRLFDLLHPYPLITDVVDNQLAWASKNSRLNVIRQYFALTRMSDRVVFNSTPNYEYFKENGFLLPGAKTATVIPNWYLMPEGAEGGTAQTPEAPKETFDVFYSGNMNDRIDWALMNDIAALGGNLRLHLVGEAGRSQDKLVKLLANPNVIYHGVMSEQMTLHLLGQADLTVMPHVVDNVSAYMNPLKVHMYAALDLPTISSHIPGIVASDYLTICKSNEAFLAEVRMRVSTRDQKKRPGSGDNHNAIPQDAQAFVDLIEATRAGSQS